MNEEEFYRVVFLAPRLTDREQFVIFGKINHTSRKEIARGLEKVTNTHLINQQKQYGTQYTAKEKIGPGSLQQIINKTCRKLRTFDKQNYENAKLSKKWWFVFKNGLFE